MYIHEVIIDGFKSYAKRTVVSGFDPQFNAITGLNGTGKSNILDSICFVLGISNLSQVRAGNLQDLVYKQGQAGVTKASVTIVFNNPDPSTSPIGQEANKQITVTRQVVIGGKNKYMINGKTVQQSEIQNLFHSVQLNVNNPHFLIMQGRITKVLNMKPVEILSMIEEAAGTRMFQTKKEQAMKTIEKKQLKVNELKNCMDNEISPQLDSLREQRQNYLDYQSNDTELQRLDRFCVASEYCRYADMVDKQSSGRKEIENELTSVEALKKEKKTEADECQKKIEEMEQQLQSEMKSEFQELKKAEEDLSKDLVKVKTLLKNHQETLNNEKDATVTLQKQVDQVKVTLVEKEQELDQCSTTLANKESEVDVAEKAAKLMCDRYQNAVAGVADDTTAEVLSLPEQVATWEKKAREAQSQLQTGAQRSEHAKKSLKELQKNAKTQQQSHSQSMKELDNLRQAIATLESKIQTCGVSCSPAEESSLRSKAGQLQTSTATLKDEIERLTTQLQARLNFDFKDPERGFDRTRVKGLVAKLITVKDKQNATALEVVAGAKLYQVVVDNEQTSRMLIDKKDCLKTRYTFLPLTKLGSVRCTEADKVARAKDIAIAKGTTAALAVELVGYDMEVQKAIELVFGNTIVCGTADVAKEIMQKLRLKTVTLDGDVFDPTGTMSGGAKNQLGTLLSKMSDLTSATEQLHVQQQELTSVETILSRLESQGAASKVIEEELEFNRHALMLSEGKLAESDYAQISTEIASLESQITTLEQEAKTLTSTYQHANEELKKLKDAEKNVKKARETAMKDLENNMKKSAKTASQAREGLMSYKNRRDGLSAEVDNLRRDLASLGEQLAIGAAAVERLVMEVENLTRKTNECKDKYEAAKVAKVAKEEQIAGCSKEIKALLKDKAQFEKEAEAAVLESNKIKHKLAEWDKNAKDAKKRMEELVDSHGWISREKKFFGVKDSDFDFETKDVEECKKRLKLLKTEQEKLSKKINKKVMGMLQQAEDEYNDLNKKRQIIVNDKTKIETVIDELDVKKSQALQTTWTRVNRDFGSIFSMLLPGTTAKLEPPEGGSVLDGLEVKVAFNGVWKESLTELSGGQRSLLALSLILSLLLFKPAPMYILDEVDAALDLSHTQNIGMMLRTHFSTSQFIVVSLKEGMFNNANVIFRTRFVDGVSAVSRTVVGSKNRAQQQALEDAAAAQEEENNAPQKKKTKATGGRAKGAAATELEM